MAIVFRVQSVITEDEYSDLKKETEFQKRKASSLIRKYITDGLKKDQELRVSERVNLVTQLINKIS